MDLNITWFILYGVLITGYAILDGFDLGVGVIHLFTKNETEKRININSIAPVWDGNEVWLLTAGGALFAAFPIVYATVFSAFYMALMLLLLFLIMRAVSMEFRGKIESSRWKKIWDISFGLGSLFPAILFGVAVGNILRGIPLNAKGIFTGNFFTLLNPYSILIGILSLVMFTLHGSIYLAMKTENDHQKKILNIIPKLWIAFVSIFFLATIYSFFEAGFLFEGILGNPLFWIAFIILFIAIMSIPIMVKSKRLGWAFLSSAVSISGMISIAAISLFPRLVPSLTDLSYSLTIYNSSSTHRTLFTMLIIALIGVPIVLIYTIFIYRKFKGKVELNEYSY